MKACTCPECGEPLRITCPSNHARAAAGVLETLVTPATLAARKPASASFRPRGDSVSATVLRVLPVGRDVTVDEIAAAVRAHRPASDGNVSVTLVNLTKAGVLRRVRRGIYRRVAA